MKKYIFAILAVVLPTMLLAQTPTTKYLYSGIAQELENNTLYRIPFDNLVLNMKNGQQLAPLSLSKGTTAAIELISGQKLVVYGSDAYIQTEAPERLNAACPGIMLPEGATLIVFGNGEVIACGGNAAQGFIGKNGGTPYLDHHSSICADGGAGGHGGSGSAPGIGGVGGVGGSGAPASIGASIRTNNIMYKNLEPVNGADGSNGSDGGSMGTLMLIGNIKITSAGGNGCQFIAEYATHGANATWFTPIVDLSFASILESWVSYAGYGGAGGNGGAGDVVKYDIGGGAPGAGGGGAGAAGGVYSVYYLSPEPIYMYHGEGGKGGDSFDSEISGMHGEGHAYFSSGGKGGKPGQYGSNGSILATGNVTINGSYDPSTLTPITSSDQIPESLRQLMGRKIVGATWADGSKELDMYYNQEMPTTSVNTLTDESKGNFLGYVDQYGKTVYDGKGNVALDKKNHSQNFYCDTISSKWYVTPNDSVMLHPRWSGVKNIHVVRYMENPNFHGNSADPKRYLSSDSIFTEMFTIPAEQKETTLQVPLFINHDGKTVVDKSLYAYAGDATDYVDVTIPTDQSVVTVELMFNEKQFQLAYEGMDEELISNQCVNIDDYTRAGSLPFGRAINLPAFRQWKGRALDHWEQKGKDGKYQTMTAGVMPTHDVTLRPVFKDVLFSTQLISNGHGTVDVSVVTKQGTVKASSLAGIPYDAKVIVTMKADADYRRCRAEAVYNGTRKTIDADVTEETMTFNMPDDDVIIYVENEYHPHATLAVLKSTENALGAENIVYYVTKDDKTYYTNDNDYYKFKGDSFGGKIADMVYGLGDKLKLYTDFKGDDGSRESKLYVIRKYSDGTMKLEEIYRSQTGSADNTFFFYQLQVDSAMVKTDMPLEILWSNPRTKYHIESVNTEKSKITKIYSNGTDITQNPVSYMHSPIEFSVETTDSTFSYTNNIIMEYFNAYDQVLITDGFGLKDGNIVFAMPESDVRITLTEGTQHNIRAKAPGDGTVLSAPFRAVAGYPVVCTIKFADGTDVPDDADIHILVNGEDVETSMELRYNSAVKTLADYYGRAKAIGIEQDNHVRTRAFVMPDTDAVVTLVMGKVAAIRDIDADSTNDTGAYNLQGQKVAEMQNGRVVSGTMPKGVVIVNGNKYLNK